MRLYPVLALSKVNKCYKCFSKLDGDCALNPEQPKFIKSCRDDHVEDSEGIIYFRLKSRLTDKYPVVAIIVNYYFVVLRSFGTFRSSGKSKRYRIRQLR